MADARENEAHGGKGEAVSDSTDRQFWTDLVRALESVIGVIRKYKLPK